MTRRPNTAASGGVPSLLVFNLFVALVFFAGLSAFIYSGETDKLNLTSNILFRWLTMVAFINSIFLFISDAYRILMSRYISVKHKED